MVDLTDTIIPKSDQLNADDLIGRTLTIKITGVNRCKEPEQPIALSFEGDNGKPYKPGKSMRRVLVNVWGPDGQGYVGRSLTLYRDDEVVFGGLKVGGIRISNMSDITKNVTMALTASRASRKPFTVQPMKVSAPAKASAAPQESTKGIALANDIVDLFTGAENLTAHMELVDANQEQFAWLKENAPRLWTEKVEPAVKASHERNSTPADAEVEEV